MLAPQAYLRITSVGIEDPIGYVISVIMVVFSVAALWAVGAHPQGPRLRDAAARRHVAAAARADAVAGGRSPTAGSACVLLLVLSPHLGILLLSLSQGVELQRPARGLHARPLRDGVHAVVADDRQHARSIAALAALLDVVLGTAIAYLILRTRLPGRQLLDFAASRGAGDSRRGARDRLPAHVPRRRAAVHATSAFTATLARAR